MPPLNSFDKTLIALALSQITLVAPAAVIDVSASCSLADAIRSANTASSVGSCLAGSDGDDTINLPANSTITLSTPAIDGEAGGDSGLPLIASTITI